MLQCERHEGIRINVIKAFAPFSLDELVSLLSRGSELARDTREYGWATLLDLKDVDIEHVSESDLRRHMMKKSAICADLPNIPCAYLVSDLTSYSAVRLANVYSDLAGVTPETQTFITQEFGEASDWLATVTAQSRHAVYEALHGALTPST